MRPPSFPLQAKIVKIILHLSCCIHHFVNGQNSCIPQIIGNTSNLGTVLYIMFCIFVSIIASQICLTKGRLFGFLSSSIRFYSGLTRPRL